ncbi:thioredoxin domain-containing protein (plasmid) [Pseudomonas sp. FeN3W]|nr:thioredoxin domain-containing protein [Pseudomonas sp. FeN3W]
MKKIDKLLIAGVLGAIALFGLSLLPGTPSSSDISSPIQGTHYTNVSEEPLVKDDVVLFFWYGCPHCKKAYEVMEFTGFEESLAASGKKLRKIPVAANETWALHAKLFYALDKAGLSSEGHGQVMQLIQDMGANKEKDLPKVIDRVIADEKARNEKFKSTTKDILSELDSSYVNRKMSEGSKVAEASKIQGVPAMLVNGTSSITLGGAVTYIDFPVVALKLVIGDVK